MLGKIQKKFFFSLRTIISLCTNQKVAELLMDNRYAYMSAYSKYTNIEKLLVEKFKPPYKCCLEVWIINRLLVRLPIIHKCTKDKNSIVLNDPRYMHGNRIENTVGGKIKVPSLWFDDIILDINEILDEAFIYVHTAKEPSNIHHENIGAIKTIIDFQKNYDSLSEKRKLGILLTENDLDSFLLDDIKIGCYSNCIYNSVEYTINLEKPYMKKIIHEINDESISENYKH